VITASQIRAARASLGISAIELAELSGVSRRTIGTMESVDGIPEVNIKSLLMIQKALEQAGIEFIGAPDDRPGIRLNRPGG
jgi:transcriptional regulator with XRE-family HTH domain